MAAHAPGLNQAEQRAVISAVLAVLADPPFLQYWLHAARPLPSVLDVLEAWAHDRRGKLGSGQRIYAANTAFFVALIVALAIDRIGGARFGAGTRRTAVQAALVVAIWLPLIPLVRGLWRVLIDRSVARVDFASAFGRAWPRIGRASESASETERSKQAQRVRTNLNSLATRAFS